MVVVILQLKQKQKKTAGTRAACVKVMYSVADTTVTMDYKHDNLVYGQHQ